MSAVGVHAETQINNKHNNERFLVISTTFIWHMTTYNHAILHQLQNISLEYRHSTEYSRGECRKSMSTGNESSRELIFQGSEYSWERKFQGPQAISVRRAKVTGSELARVLLGAWERIVANWPGSEKVWISLMTRCWTRESVYSAWCEKNMRKPRIPTSFTCIKLWNGVNT